MADWGDPIAFASHNAVNRFLSELRKRGYLQFRASHDAYEFRGRLSTQELTDMVTAAVTGKSTR